MIPDCFDPGVPLLSQQPPAASGLASSPSPKQQLPPSTVEQQQQQQSNVQEPTGNLITFDEPMASPTKPLQGNSEPRPQEAVPGATDKLTSKGSPQRPPPLTPYQMLSNPRTHILGRNPWQVGAAFIDSTMNQIDQHFGQPSGMYATKSSTSQKMENEMNFQKKEASKNDTTPTGDTDDDEFQVELHVCLLY